MDYSARKLTLISDKFRGIAGLAASWNRYGMPGEYLRGLWSGALAETLPWTIVVSKVKPAIEAKYLAPSWSWTSLVGAQARVWEDVAQVVTFGRETTTRS